MEGLRRACAEVHEIAKRRPVLVVPGGGPFADAVRAVDQQVGLDDAVAHRLALHAMDQLGVLLAPLLPGRDITVLAVAQAFAGRPDVPESWDVTSDSLAVLAAGAIGAEEAVLVKPVEPPASTMTAGELKALQEAGEGTIVDRYMPEAVRRTGVTAVVRAVGGVGVRITPD
jgi:5-(aminomethyl)-3-furanmethanol phosphate kinase